MIPRKALGQHFLKDMSVVETMVRAIAPQSSDFFIEIGPGTGILTESIAYFGASMCLLEVDERCVRVLKERFKASPHLSIQQIDALNYDYKQHASRSVRWLGNLPYHLSSAFLLLFCRYHAFSCDFHLMLQKEVVSRLVARPSEKAMGRLTLHMQRFFQMTHLFDVPPEAFDPPPSVNSSVVRLKPHPEGPVPVGDEQPFERLIQKAFQKRRKTLQKIFEKDCGPEVWRQAQIDPSLRPENLALSDWIRLNQSLGPRS